MGQGKTSRRCLRDAAADRGRRATGVVTAGTGGRLALRQKGSAERGRSATDPPKSFGPEQGPALGVAVPPGSDSVAVQQAIAASPFLGVSSLNSRPLCSAAFFLPESSLGRQPLTKVIAPCFSWEIYRGMTGAWTLSTLGGKAGILPRHRAGDRQAPENHLNTMNYRMQHPCMR